MAQPSADSVAKSLIDQSRREVLWPSVFSGVKNVVRSNNLNSETLACIKGWLKSNDSQLHVPLLSLTVLHTMSLNCSTTVRNQMTSLKLFQRFEKQLARPQGPQVATAIVQVLVDWAHLFPQEELGARSRALLAQPRYSQMAAGFGPSPAVQSMQEELRLGIPPVAPVKGEDFIRWMYRGAGGDNGPLGFSPGSGGGSGGGFTQASQAGAQGLPGGAPPPISTQAVPQLCQRMQADAQRLTAALAACRKAAAARRTSELTPALDAGYREAERCSQWRRRVQEFTQHCGDDHAVALSALLAATDVLNGALQNWQLFTGREVYDTMRIAVPPMPPAIAAATAAGAQPARTNGAGAGAQYDIDMLLGIAPHPTTQVSAGQQQQPFDPFDVPPAEDRGNGAGGSGSGPPRTGALPVPSSNPFAAAAATAVSGPMSAPSSPHGATTSYPRAGHGTTGSEHVRQHAAAPPAASASSGQSGMAAARTGSHHRSQPTLWDWDPFGARSGLPPDVQSPSARGVSDAGGGNGSGSLPAAPSGAGSSFGWAQFGNSDGAVASAASGSYSASARGPSSSQPSGALASNPTSPTGTAFSPTQGGILAATAGVSDGRNGSGTTRSAVQPVGEIFGTAGRATTPQHPATVIAAAAAGAASVRPHPPGTSPSTPNGLHRAAANNGTSPAAAGAAATPSTSPSIAGGPGGTAVAIAAFSSLAASPAAAAASPPATATGGFGPAGPSGHIAGANASSLSSLDWRLEFDRLASDLRSLLAASPAAASNGGASGAGGLPLPAVLSRVQGLCEALAAQHADRLTALEARLGRVKGSEWEGSAAAGQFSGSGGSAGAGGGFAARAAAGTGTGAQLGPLQQGLQQQHQHQQPYQRTNQHPQQPYRSNGVTGSGLPNKAGGNGGGSGPLADLSLI